MQKLCASSIRYLASETTPSFLSCVWNSINPWKTSDTSPLLNISPSLSSIISGTESSAIITSNGLLELENYDVRASMLQAENLKLNNRCYINAPITADIITIRNDGKDVSSLGNLECREYDQKGTARVTSLKADRMIKVNGKVRLYSELSCKSLWVKGSIQVNGGGIHSNVINIELPTNTSKSYCENILCDKISISRWLAPGEVLETSSIGLFSLPLWMSQTQFQTDTIRGDEIELEFVSALIVKGRHVIIGPGCHIITMEHRGSFEIHETSRVENIVDTSLETSYLL